MGVLYVISLHGAAMSEWLEDPGLHGLDCGDNSCRYRVIQGGMRTNGGCRCATQNPQGVQRFLLRNYYKAKEKIAQLETTLEMEKVLKDG